VGEFDVQNLKGYIKKASYSSQIRRFFGEFDSMLEVTTGTIYSQHEAAEA